MMMNSLAKDLDAIRSDLSVVKHRVKDVCDNHELSADYRQTLNRLDFYLGYYKALSEKIIAEITHDSTEI